MQFHELSQSSRWDTKPRVMADTRSWLSVRSFEFAVDFEDATSLETRMELQLRPDLETTHSKGSFESSRTYLGSCQCLCSLSRALFLLPWVLLASIDPLPCSSSSQSKDDMSRGVCFLLLFSITSNFREPSVHLPRIHLLMLVDFSIRIANALLARAQFRGKMCGHSTLSFW